MAEEMREGVVEGKVCGTARDLGVLVRMWILC